MSLLSYNLTDGLVSASLHLQHFGSLFPNSGTMTLGAFEVTAQGSPDMSVKVAGSANDDKVVLITDDGDTYFIKNTADLNVTILANSSGVTKTDTIVVYLDLTAGDDAVDGSPSAASCIAVRRAGVSTGAATDGEIDSATSNNPWFKLATVSVLNGETEITGAEITDVRLSAWLGANFFGTDHIPGTALEDDGVTADKRSEVVKVGRFTTTTNGSQAVTGVGFQPKAVLFIMNDPDHLSNAVANMSFGFSDGTTHASTGFRAAEGGDIAGSTSTSVAGYLPGGSSALTNTLTLTSLDADGFTVTVGGYAANCDFAYMAFA